MIFKTAPSPSQIISFITPIHCHLSFKMESRVLLAAEQGDRKSMQAFITDRQVDVVNEEGCTPLMVAAANGRDEIIRLLLEQEVSVLMLYFHRLQLQETSL